MSWAPLFKSCCVAASRSEPNWAKAANSRYFYELASAKFGWDIEKAKKVQAFHFKGGQGAKTGTGGHLPGNKVIGKIAEVRNLNDALLRKDNNIE